MAQDALMISQAEQVESLTSDGLVSVSDGAGQPQKNISIANLANAMGEQAGDVTDITSLWGQTSDGQMVQISKSSIASVLGNLLYGATDASSLATVVAEKITPFLVLVPTETSIDDLIISIAFKAKTGFSRFSTSWSEHSGGFSGFCSKSGYGSDNSTEQLVSGIIQLKSDGTYLFLLSIDSSTNECSYIKKTRLDWA